MYESLPPHRPPICSVLLAYFPIPLFSISYSFSPLYEMKLFLRLCSRYVGKLFHRHENHTDWRRDFCDGSKLRPADP